MRTFFFLLFFASALVADFYIISKDQKVKMTEFATGQIDFAWFGDFAFVHRGDDAIHAMGDEIAFNHKHLNFRIATIDIPQSNSSLTEYSQKSADVSNKYFIDFAKHKREDGAMLQLFYHNKWYGVILGDPKEALYTLFGRDDLQSDKAIEGLQRALIAFKNDSYLKERLDFYNKKKAGEKQVPAEYKKQIPIDFKNLPKSL